jgi:hypothetical protein
MKPNPHSIRSQGLIFEPRGYVNGEIRMRVYYADDYPALIGKARAYLSGELLRVSSEKNWIRDILDSWSEIDAEERERLWLAAGKMQQEKER